MSKKVFSDIEVSKLSKNKNIFKVSNRAITYTFEFKNKFIDEYKTGKFSRIIFEKAGLDVEIIGKKRIQTASNRWRKAFKEQGELGLKDTRKISSGRPLKRELTDSEKNRNDKETRDLKSKILILKAFNRRGFKKGARSIRMILENEFNTLFNLKIIGRIMRKYNIICPHRKPNKYKQIAKATKEHSTVSNELQREFKQGIPRKVLLTDISYLSFENGKRAYLSAIKDSSTNEILAYEVSDNLKLEIATNTIEKLCKKKFKLAK